MIYGCHHHKMGVSANRQLRFQSCIDRCTGNGKMAWTPYILTKYGFRVAEKMGLDLWCSRQEKQIQQETFHDVPKKWTPQKTGQVFKTLNHSATHCVLGTVGKAHWWVQLQWGGGFVMFKPMVWELLNVE